ncbi:heat-inducible transcriptional repressor HrcA [soil metagenome]
MTLLDERKASILRAVVEEYIDTAQPVGSGHVSRAADVSVSSATVRNEMAVLEQEGYLHQPHTSAGRVPTDKGYRFFVDDLAGPGRLDAARSQQVRSFFAHTHGELEQMLRDTSRLLSNLTDYAAVVVGPPHEAATVRSVQLVNLGGGIALAVIVLSNGVVEKRSLDLTSLPGAPRPGDGSAGAGPIDDGRLAAAGAHLNGQLVDRALVGFSIPSPTPTGDDRTDAVVAAVVEAFAGSEHTDDQVFVGGAARMASAFDAVDTVRRVLTILEEQFVVVGLLRDVLDRGLSVAIGAETGMETLAECSLVVAPYEVEGEVSGSIGVLGPTRMHYPQALAAVAVVSNRLGRRLSEG